jgi:hypothetical protein
MRPPIRQTERTMNRMVQSPGEEDEAFLLRAERAMQLEGPLVLDPGLPALAQYKEAFVQDQARGLVGAALDAFDKPEGIRRPGETLRSLLVEDLEEELDVADRQELDVANRRSLLVARAMLRARQDLANGSDTIAQRAYELVSQLAIELMRDGGDPPLA